MHSLTDNVTLEEEESLDNDFFERESRESE
jgi:hypothetical protein